MSDFWQDFESISAAVDRVRDAGARAVQADLDGAVADLSAACSDFIGASVRIRWHQEEKPPVSGAGARKIKEVVRKLVATSCIPSPTGRLRLFLVAWSASDRGAGSKLQSHAPPGDPRSHLFSCTRWRLFLVGQIF